MRASSPRVPLWNLLGRPTLLVLGLAAIGFALNALPTGLNTGLVDRFVTGPGGWGGAVFVGVGAASSAAGLPRQAVAFAGGYAFGVWGGLGLGLIAQILGCALSFSWARMLGRRWAVRRMPEGLARADRFLAANPFTATLTFRLLPVGNNLALNLLAGVSTIPALPFLAASLLGYVPQSTIFVLLGSGARLGHTAQLVLGTLLFGGSAALGIVLFRRHRKAAEMGSAHVGSRDGDAELVQGHEGARAAELRGPE
jgi:uncharacterized membrane protein YdjX (TVP38/TMEM64 family)